MDAAQPGEWNYFYKLLKTHSPQIGLEMVGAASLGSQDNYSLNHQVPGQPKVAFTHVYGAPGISSCAVLTR